jgi:hypothetical protein
MQPLVRCVLDGFNVAVIAYGQTGSGKTFTMSGPQPLKGSDTFGVNYRALDDLFHMAHVREQEYEYSFSVQVLEIYNEQVYHNNKLHNNKLSHCANTIPGNDPSFNPYYIMISLTHHTIISSTHYTMISSTPHTIKSSTQYTLHDR